MTSDTDKPKFAVNGAQVVGSALAAVTSAVLLSTLGAAGTIIGAAGSSLVFTVGGAFYARSVQAGRERVAQAAAVAKEKVQQSRQRQVVLPPGALAERAEARDDQADAEDELDRLEDDGPADAVSWRDTLRQLPWRRIVAVSAGIFVAVMVAILAFELTVGRSVSSFTGGSESGSSSTTIPFGQGAKDGTDPQDGTENDGGSNDGGTSTDRAPSQNDPVPGRTEAPTPAPSPTPAPTVVPTEPQAPPAAPAPGPAPGA